MKIISIILAILAWALVGLQISVYGDTPPVPSTPTEMGLEPPKPVAVSYDAVNHVTTWSDGTKTTNTPSKVTLKVTYYDNLTSNAIYTASFTTEYRKNAFMKTEIIEE